MDVSRRPALPRRWARRTFVWCSRPPKIFACPCRWPVCYATVSSICSLTAAIDSTGQLSDGYRPRTRATLHSQYCKGDAMERIAIGQSGLTTSRIGLGTWAIGGWMWGGTDEAQSIATIRSAVERGITLIDTAPAYGFGHSEEIVGKGVCRRIAARQGADCDQGRPGME